MIPGGNSPPDKDIGDLNDWPMKIFTYGSYIIYTLWLFNVAMENVPFIDVLWLFTY